jgi:predicted secreted protein
MAHRAGKAGQVDWDNNEVTGIKSWTLDYTVDMLDTTDFGDSGVRSYLSGCSSWSGTFEGYKDGTPEDVTTGTACTLKLYETQETDEYWTGSAYITAVHPATSFDGIASYSYNFQGTGALTPAAK